MSKTNYIKSVTDILYEGYANWWAISNIVAKFYNMPDDDFGRLPVRIRGDLYEQFKTYIGQVRANFDEMGEMLLSRKFNGTMCFKRATGKDEQYIISELNKNENVRKQAEKRLDTRKGNVKKKGLLPEDGKE